MDPRAGGHAQMELSASWDVSLLKPRISMEVAKHGVVMMSWKIGYGRRRLE